MNAANEMIDTIQQHPSVPDDDGTMIGWFANADKPKGMDAAEWANYWVETIKTHPSIPVNRDAMIGWFANVALAGYEAAATEYTARCEAIAMEVAEAVCADCQGSVPRTPEEAQAVAHTIALRKVLK